MITKMILCQARIITMVFSIICLVYSATCDTFIVIKLKFFPQLKTLTRLYYIYVPQGCITCPCNGWV